MKSFCVYRKAWKQSSDMGMRRMNKQDMILIVQQKSSMCEVEEGVKKSHYIRPA